MNKKIKPILKWLLKTTGSILSAVRNNIVIAILLGFAGGYVGLLSFSKTVYKASIDTINTATPLWVSILAIIACCLYTYLKTHKNPYKQSKNEEKSIESDLKLKFGAYWDKDANPYCSYCKTPLQTVKVEHYGDVTLSCCKCSKPLKLSEHGKLVSMKYVTEEVKKMFIK
jgi:hypothetical protein